MYNKDVLEKAGRTVVLLGNEAIARGALEAGVGFCAAYPGSPSSEIGMTLSSVAKRARIYFEWSTNEKVAFEAAAGAAYCGARSLAAMKHFGLNVASDSVYPVLYTGVRGGMVLVVADDPQGMCSAQSEQDTRYCSRMGNIPTIEPSNAQEAKDFTKLAFEISEKHQLPVMLRTTTRVSHSIGSVKLGRKKKPRKKGRFKKDFDRFYNIRPELQKLHLRVLKKLKKIEAYSEQLNRIEGSGKIGIICNGVSYEYIKELKLKKVKIAKLGLTYPIPTKFIARFLKGLKTVIVVEELEPVIEDFVRQVAKDVSPKVEIHGKDILPRQGEYSSELISEKISPILKLPKASFAAQERSLKKIKLPMRKAVMCPGCPHRSTFYAVKKVLGEDVVWGGDIGCYDLGSMRPFEMQDFIISMGASAGITHGIKKVSGQKAVLFMGDSTFFHAGMPGIVNLKDNDSDLLVVIMDNKITAMTGHQPHPGSRLTGMGEVKEPIKIEKIIQGMGIENMKTANAFNQKKLRQAVKGLKGKGLAVLVSQGECRLLTHRKLERAGKEFTHFKINPSVCIRCGECLSAFACPAIIKEKGNFKIDRDLCWGCGVCSQICPAGAINPEVKKK